MVFLGVLLLLVAVGGLTARNLDSRRQKVLVAASLAPFLMAASVPATILLAAGAGWVGFAFGAVVVIVTAATRVPLYRRRFVRRRSTGDLTVMQANIFLGTADAASLVAEVRGGAVDVLTVEELTPDSVAALHDAGLDDELPYRFVRPRPGGHGTGIWSRYPLTEERRHDGFVAEQLSARVEVPGARSVLVFAVHPVPPWPREPRAWYRELALLRELLDKLPEGDGPVIVSGDFNATWDHKRFRGLVSGRFDDAAAAVGAGSVPTYAADRWYPSIIAIDHVLVAEATVIGVGAVRLPGSDHRGVWARISLS